VLHKLNLKVAWRTFLPLDGKRDGIESVQVLDGQVLVQTHSGALMMLNGETGQTQWITLIGQPYRANIPPSANESAVIGLNGTRMFGLERNTGQLLWEFDLPNAATAPIGVDSDRAYVCITGGRFHVYQMFKKADPNAPGTAPPAIEKKKAPEPAYVPMVAGKVYGSASKATSILDSPGRTYFGISPLSSITDANRLQLVRGKLPLVYEIRADSRLEVQPLLTPRNPDNAGYVVLAGADGQVLTMSKTSTFMNYKFRVEAPISAPGAQYVDTAYMAFRDGTVFAMHMESGLILWRTASPKLVSRKPDVSFEDVYLAPMESGLMRLSRARGDVHWRNTEADRFLAANKKFTYAFDRRGHLLVLDRARGTVLASHDTRDFAVPITNTTNERLFLAANDGQLICLYDRDTPPPGFQPAAKGPDKDKDGKEMKKDMEKKER